tara:strand:- start:80496 stop:81317 length:822 start_codon:yes stop_codon:yes gene_type:complete
MVKFWIFLAVVIAAVAGVYFKVVAPWHLGAAVAVSFAGFYVYRKFYKKNWDDFVNSYGRKMKWTLYFALFVAVFNQPIWFYGTTLLLANQQVFVLKTEAVGSKGVMEVDFIYPHGQKVWGWNQEPLPEGIHLISDKEIKLADGSIKPLSEVFPNMEIVRVLNYQMQWIYRKNDTTKVFNVLNTYHATGKPATVWITGWYIELDQWVQDLFCKDTGDKKGSCMATQFNIVDVEDDGMPRPYKVWILYSFLMLLSLVCMRLIGKKMNQTYNKLTK